MIRQRKLTATAGAALSAALLLTGCTDGGQESPTSETTPASASESSPAPIPENPLSSSPAAGSSGSSSAGSGSASESDRVEAFEPVKAEEAPKTYEEGKEMGWKAVQRYYEAQTKLLQDRDPEQVDELSSIVSGPYLEQEKAALTNAFEGKKRTYEGASEPELIQATAGPLIWPDGSRTDYSSVVVRVCEDNSGVTVTDEAGKELPTGADRYVLDFSTRWDEQNKRWTVTGSSEPSEDDPGVQTC